MINRKQIFDRGAGFVRGGTRRAQRLGRWGGSFAAGKLSALRNRSAPKAGMTDATLKAKVESEIFRPAGAPKGSVDVDVVDHVVELRGEVKRPEHKEALEDAARAIPEVRDVRNLLHLPKVPSPTRADSPGRARRKSPERSKPRDLDTRSSEQPVSEAEPSPREAASTGEGRRAAPLGSSGEEAE